MVLALVNKKGHTTTLVATHPGNRNAAKSGVYSAEILAERAAEAEVALKQQRPEDVARDFLLRELAGLTVLRDAMDRELESGGIRGRGGEPRSLINLRLRLNERVRRTAAEYVALTTRTSDLEVETPPESNDSTGRIPNLLEVIASWHDRESINELSPDELDPQHYLGAVIVTQDSAVNIRTKRRARWMLTRVERPAGCSCCFTRRARDEFEFRSWIDEARRSGIKPAPADDELASLVRQVVARELEYPYLHKRTRAAIQEAISGLPDQDWKVRHKEERAAKVGRTLNPFWTTLLSDDPNLDIGDRLTAFAALREANAFRQCSCRATPKLSLWEEKLDAGRAALVRLLVEKHRQAAIHIAWFPQTYHALQDSIDKRVVDERSASLNERGHKRNETKQHGSTA